MCNNCNESYLDINVDYENMRVKGLREVLKAECLGLPLYKMKKHELLRVIYDLLDSDLPARDQKLIQDFEKICSLGTKNCRIRRPDGSYLFHYY